MINISLLGKTSFDGEVLLLEANSPYEISAVRITVSDPKSLRLLGKDVMETEDIIKFVSSHPHESKKLVRKILEYYHGDIGEMYTHGILLKDVSRLFTFIGWMPIGAPRGLQGVGTERSLRYVGLKEKNFLENNNSNLSKINEKAFEVYQELRKSGAKKEDARYALPLSTLTEEIMQIPLGRELEKWSNYLEIQPFQECREIGNIVRKYNEELTGFSSPSPEYPPKENFMYLYEKEKKREEEIRNIEKELFKNEIKKPFIHYDPLTEVLIVKDERSISSWHQEVRNRQVMINWPSWEEVVKNENFIVPPTIPREKISYLTDFYREAHQLGIEEWSKRNEETSVYIQPLGKKMNVLFKIFGNHNIFSTVRLRACLRAQHEIRATYRRISSRLKSQFPYKLGARCEVEGKCYEPNKETCPLYSKFVEN